MYIYENVCIIYFLLSLQSAEPEAYFKVGNDDADSG